MTDVQHDPAPAGAKGKTPASSPPAARGAETVDAATGEIVPAGDSGLAFADLLSEAGMSEYVADMKATDDESPEAIQVEIARRILSADSVDAVWGATRVLTARDVLNQPIVVERVRWITSAHKAGAPKFAIIEGKRLHGDEPITVSCGAMNVVLTLYKLQKFGALPATVMISAKPSGSAEGRSVLTIAPAP